ncbi:MAG TPA: hypothetical protein VJW75_10900 [Candidatus Eisenbacteria bacterium]|nr:hypothetical protein [Candidatus Eisenbacteria bacterium]
MPRALLFTLILLFSFASSAAANDDADSLRPHSRVRLSVYKPELTRILSGAPLSKKQLRREQFIGTLQGRRDDDVVIRVGDPQTELAVPATAVERIEYSRGMHGCGVEGATVGILAGAAGGVGLALIACSGGDCEEDSRGMLAALFGGVGALVGATVGAITGSQMRCESWRGIPVKDLPYGDGLPQETGIRFALAAPRPHY